MNAEIKKFMKAAIFAVACIVGFLIVISFCGCAATPVGKPAPIATAMLGELTIPPSPTPAAFTLVPVQTRNGPPSVYCQKKIIWHLRVAAHAANDEKRLRQWQAAEAIHQDADCATPDHMSAFALEAGVKELLAGNCAGTATIAARYRVFALQELAEQCPPRQGRVHVVDTDTATTTAAERELILEDVPSRILVDLISRGLYETAEDFADGFRFSDKLYEEIIFIAAELALHFSRCDEATEIYAWSHAPIVRDRAEADEIAEQMEHLRCPPLSAPLSDETPIYLRGIHPPIEDALETIVDWGDGKARVEPSGKQ